MNIQKNKKLITILIITVICILTGILSANEAFSSWQKKLTNKLFVTSDVSDDIIILELDDKSIATINEGKGVWNNSSMITVFQNILNLEPSIVAIDMRFNNPTTGIKDKELRNILTDLVLGGTNGAVSIEDISKKFTPYVKSPNDADVMLGNIMKDKRIILAVSPADVSQIGKHIFKKEELFRSIDSIHNNAAHIANIGVDIDPQDSLVRKYFTEIQVEEVGRVGSLAVAAAELYGSPYVKQIPVIDDNNRMYINYFGAPGAYKRVPAIDAFDGKLKKEDIEGKIVLFGPVSSIFNDLEHTPISPEEQMPGVEIHANALQTILDGKFLVDASAVMKVVLIVLITAISVFAFMYSSIRVAISVAVLLWISYYFGNKVAFGRGIILDQMYPYFAIILSLVTVFIYRFFTESKEKTFIADAFGSYVSPDVLAEIIKDPTKLALGGEEKIVTVLFSDIKDSTTISENMSAHGLVELLNEYFTVMSDIVINNGGTVDKFEGDAVMAVFGAPIGDPNHAALACRAAIEMQNKLIGLREKWKSEGKPELFVRIGINSGPVVAGNIGSKDRFDYTVMGDTVNLGSRLEGANKQYGTEIMIGENTANLIQNSEFKDMFTLRYLDKITVKGKTQAVEVFELKGVETTP